MNPLVHRDEQKCSPARRACTQGCLYSIIWVYQATGQPNAFLASVFRTGQTGSRKTKPLRRRPEMKSIANRLFVFAAFALSLGTFAYGQTTLKANVPFAFAVPGGPAQAGQYIVQFENVAGNKIVHISNRKTGRSVLTLSNRLEGNVNAVLA